MILWFIVLSPHRTWSLSWNPCSGILRPHFVISTLQNTQRIRGNLNEYDFDDSFIVNDDDGNDDSEYDEDEDENGDSDGTESDDVHSGVSRTRRYALRHNGPALVISLPSDRYSYQTYYYFVMLQWNERKIGNN